MTCCQNGNAANGWQDAGTCLYLHSIKVTGDSAVTNAFVGFRGAKTSGEMTAGQVTAGVWTDVFGTFVQNADNTQYTVTLSVCPTPASGKPDLTTQTLTPSKALALSFNSGNLTLGGYHDSAASASTTRSFRGVIADFMIWERALTEEEKYEVMAGRHGAKWTVGAVNGSADEFNDGANASVAVADPYLPESQPWNRMRKTLDAAHPTRGRRSRGDRPTGTGAWEGPASSGPRPRRSAALPRRPRRSAALPVRRLYAILGVKQENERTE